MKTLKLTDKAYADLLELKNHMSIKLRQITNPEIHESDDLSKVIRKINFEPEFDFSECISSIIGSVWNEQETGEVNFIT